MATDMTTRQRWLAAVNMQPVDHLPFWPKLGGSYSKNQCPPFSDMPIDDIHTWTGSDDHPGVSGGIRIVQSNCSEEVHRDKHTLRTVYHTPAGDAEMVLQFDEGSHSWHPVQFPVRRPEDIAIMLAYYRDQRIELDPEDLAKARARAAEIGESAASRVGIGTSPMMNWVEHLAGVENGHYFLADDPARVEELFETMQAILVRKAELLVENAPADLFYLMENTSTTLISPDQFRTYCLPQIRPCADIAAAAGKAAVLHMCGHIKVLLKDLATLPVRAFEAFTSPTLGNTTLLDGRTDCPDVCLIGGTNAMLWTQPADTIIAKIEADLDVLPHHRGLVVTSAGVMPPSCRPETIKAVCDWVRSYSVRN